MRIRLMAAMVLGLPLSATSILANPQACARIVEDSERLACYDDHFGVAAVHTQPTQSKWSKDIRENPMTDERDVFLTLESDDTIPGRFSGAQYGRLFLRCMENTTAVQFGVGDHFLTDIQGYGRVEYRLDDTPMRKRNFTASTNNKTLGLWNGGRSIPFIKEMLGHDRMVVRITPYNESPRLMKFTISGLEAEITELRDTCSW